MRSGAASAGPHSHDARSKRTSCTPACVRSRSFQSASEEVRAGPVRSTLSCCSCGCGCVFGCGCGASSGAGVTVGLEWPRRAGQDHLMRPGQATGTGGSEGDLGRCKQRSRLLSAAVSSCSSADDPSDAAKPKVLRNGTGHTRTHGWWKPPNRHTSPYTTADPHVVM